MPYNAVTYLKMVKLVQRLHISDFARLYSEPCAHACTHASVFLVR